MPHHCPQQAITSWGGIPIGQITKLNTEIQYVGGEFPTQYPMAVHLSTGVIGDKEGLLPNPVWGLRRYLFLIEPLVDAAASKEFMGHQANGFWSLPRWLYELKIDCPDLLEAVELVSHTIPRSC